MSGRPPFLPIYSHESMEDTRKGYLLSKMVYIRDRDWNQVSKCTTSINDQYDGKCTI